MARRRRARRIVMGAVGAMALAYIGVSAAVWFLQTRLIFLPERGIDSTPAEYGAVFERVSLPIGADRIAGWWLPAEAPHARTLLYLHGNAGNIAANADHAVRLRNVGLNVLIIDYRGYGESTGGPPRERLAEADADRAWTYLVQERKVPPSEIVVYGHSLGGAVAIDLVSHHADAGALVTESTLTRIRDMARGTAYDWLPLGLIVTERFDSISKVPSIHVPKLFIHGDEDTLMSQDMARRLYAAAAEPKRLAIISGGHHNDSATINPAAYFQALNGFLASLDSGSRP